MSRALPSLLLSLLSLVLACGTREAPAQRAPAVARAPDFTYDATAALDVRVDGEPDRWDGVSITRLTFASPRGGRVPALLVTPDDRAEGTRVPAVILQHGRGVDKSNLLPDAILLARAGAIALLPDAPDQRPEELRTIDFADHAHDPELWEQAAIDLRRAVDVLIVRDDVDPSRIGVVGHSFGATMAAILAAVEPRIRAFVLIAPGAMTTSLREGQSADLLALRKNVPARALADYLTTMEPYDAPLWLAKAPATANVLVQNAAYDPGVPARAVDAVVASSTATTEVRRYPTGHFITSPSAMRDRLAFLDRLLQLPKGTKGTTMDTAPDIKRTHDVVITRVIDAPVERVWNAWKNADDVKRWWGPTGFTAPVAEMDFRVGGVSLVCMRAPKEYGGQDYYTTWTYRTIEPHARIEFVQHFTDAHRTKIDPAVLNLPPGIPAEVPHELTFKPLGANRTELTITERGYTTSMAHDTSVAGMNQVLDKLAAVVTESR